MKNLVFSSNGTAAAVGVGVESLWLNRQLAGARARLGARNLFKLDAQLAGFSAAPNTREADVWQSWIGTPVPLQVLHYAREFVRLLPISVDVPVVQASSDGLLSFEWSGSNARKLSVTVTADGMLVYSGRLGPRRRVSGAEPLSTDLPAMIRQSLQDVTG